MAFVEPYDPDSPAATDPVGEGDDRIRELKRALTERLVQLIEGWPDTDPLRLKGSALDDSHPTMATIKAGLIAARPNPPDTDFYFATDEDKLYVRKEVEEPDPDEWELINPDFDVGTLSVDSMAVLTLSQVFTLTVTAAANPGANVERKLNTDPLDPARYRFKSVRLKIKLEGEADTEFYWAYGLGSRALIASFGVNPTVYVKVNEIFTVEAASAGLVDWYMLYNFDNATGVDQDVEVNIEVELWDRTPGVDDE